MPNKLRSKIDPLVADLSARYSEAGTLEWLRKLWESDRWSDYTAFARTAHYAADELRRAGLSQAEVVSTPADGRTRMQAWTMPLAWEGGESILKIVSPREEVICDRSREPITCAMWSEPTPAGGVRGPLVVVDDLAKVTPRQKARLRGAIILTRLRTRGEMKVFAADAGAAAVVSDFVPHAERHPDAIGWSNGWADDGGGWALKASDRRLTGFCISPPTGDRLRRLVAAGEVICEARVGGRVGEGTLPVVTGVVPGESSDEILLVGHLYEVGVIDNASGCAAMMEAMRLLAALPRPRRTVRVLLTSECYGTYAFYTLRPEVLRRTIAGVNVDCVGEVQTAERPMLWGRTSECDPSAVDTVFRQAMAATEGLPGAYPSAEEALALSDGMTGDPAAGAPCLSFMRAPVHWHTNQDDWACFSPEAQKRASVVVAAYAGWLAQAGPADADALAETTAEYALKTFGDDCALPEPRRAFFLDRARQRVLSTKRLGARRADEIARRLPELDLAAAIEPADGGREEASLVPVRNFWGAPTFDEIPFSEREGLSDPRWNGPLVSAAWWADGRRTVREIAALVRLEYGKPADDLLKYFRVLQRGGLLTLRRP